VMKMISEPDYQKVKLAFILTLKQLFESLQCKTDRALS
jgi:hypothetical protein